MGDLFWKKKESKLKKQNKKLLSYSSYVRCLFVTIHCYSKTLHRKNKVRIEMEWDEIINQMNLHWVKIVFVCISLVHSREKKLENIINQLTIERNIEMRIQEWFSIEPRFEFSIFLWIVINDNPIILFFYSFGTLAVISFLINGGLLAKTDLFGEGR